MLSHVVKGIEKDKANTEEVEKINKYKKQSSAGKYHHSTQINTSYHQVKTWTLPSLCQAVCDRDVNKVIQLLMFDPQKYLYERDSNKRTCLHYASFYDYYGILALLLESQYSHNLLEAKDDCGKTPLFKAVETAGLASLKLLLSFSCNPTTYDSTGTTPLHVAVLEQNIELMDILLTAKANSNSIDQLGFSPLHLCCGLGFIEGVRLLLLHNANPNSKDRKGRTPLFAAATENRTKVTKILLKHGANPNIVDDEGNTSLRYLKEKERFGSPIRQHRNSQRRSVYVMGSGDVEVNQVNTKKLNKYDEEIRKVMSSTLPPFRSPVVKHGKRRERFVESDGTGSPVFQRESSIRRNTIETQHTNGVIGGTIESLLPGYIPLTKNISPRARKRQQIVQNARRKEVIPDSLVANHPNSFLEGSETDNDNSDITFPLDNEGPLNSKYLSTAGFRARSMKSPRVLNSAAGMLDESDLTTEDEDTKETLELLKSMQKHRNKVQQMEEQLTDDDSLQVLPLEQQKVRYLYEKNCELLGKKLKRCKVLQTRMNGLFDNLQLPEAPNVSKTNFSNDKSFEMLHEENEVLHNEILILRQKNAEMKNHILQYKETYVKQSSGQDGVRNNLQPASSGFEDVRNLHHTIDELLQENLKIKKEVETLNSQMSTQPHPYSKELNETKNNLEMLTKQIEKERQEREELTNKVKNLQEENTQLSGRLSMLSNIVESKQVDTNSQQRSHLRIKAKAPLPPSARPKIVEQPKLLDPIQNSIIVPRKSTVDNPVKQSPKIRKKSLWDQLKLEIPKLRSLRGEANQIEENESGDETSVADNISVKSSDGDKAKKRKSKFWNLNV